MSDEKIDRLEQRVDDHTEKISHLETGHARNDERHKRHDARHKESEEKWAWLIKTVAAIVLGLIVTAYLKGTVF